MSTDTKRPITDTPTADERRRHLASVTRRALKRCRTKLGKQQQELAEARGHEMFSQFADTLLASLQDVRRGMTACNLVNVHTGREVAIKLNPALDARENAALYFKKARKGRRAVETIEENVARTSADIDALEAIRTVLAAPSAPGQGPDEQTVDTARERLEALGVLPRSSAPPTESDRKPDVPYRHVTFEGYDIYIGRNDRQNDELTVRFAKPWDLWLHVAQHAGSHVVIRRQKNTPWPPERVIVAAASVAAWFSKAKHATSVDVHVAERRYVQKRRRTPAGEVVLLNYKSVRVNPISPQELRKLSANRGKG